MRQSIILTIAIANYIFIKNVVKIYLNDREKFMTIQY